MTTWLERRTGLRATPPPEATRSPRRVVDEATRPTVSEPDATVGFGPRGLAVGSHLLDVHAHYRAEIERVRDVSRQVREGVAGLGEARSAVNAMAVRANDWTLGGVCQAHCLAITQHHTMESEGIFVHLVDRQPELAPVVQRLHDEHLLIHELLEEVDAALVHLVQHPGDLDPLDRALDLLADTLLSHFAYEERELLAPIARFGFQPGQV